MSDSPSSSNIFAPWNTHDASTNRRRVPTPALQSSQNTLSPPESKSTSQVGDYGDTKHLEQRERFRRDSISAIVNDAFVQVGSRFPETPDSSDPVRGDIRSTEGESMSLALNKAFSSDLSGIIREKRQEAASAERRTFYAISDLEDVVTRFTARQELANLPDVDDILDKIFIPRTVCHHKTRVFRIFVILTLMGKPEAVKAFIDDEIYDLDLPFERTTAEGNWKDRDQYLRNRQIVGRIHNEVAIFKRWPAADTENFMEKQHAVCVPIFDLDTQGGDPVSHYNLHGKTILPYIENELRVEGRSEIWRVKIHPAHIICQAYGTNIHFAVKKLKNRARKPFTEESEKFIKEARNLGRFASRDHDYIIKLLCTFQWRHDYYFLFPWADGNLYDFWSRHPAPLARLKHPSTARWLSTQVLGIVKALRDIHHGDAGPSIHLSPQQKNHGNIKPENILYFKNDNEGHDLTNGACLVQLKISDLGEAEFHSTTSTRLDATDVRYAPLCSASGLRVKTTSMPTSDIFSLACVLLEFVTWYLQGFPGVERLRDHRLREKEAPVYDLGGYKEDDVFKPIDARTNESRDSLREAMYKSSVSQQIVQLWENEHCSGYISNLLMFIEGHLLQANPENQADFNTTCKAFEEFHKQCTNDETYCVDKLQRTPPARVRTETSLITDIEIEFPEELRIQMTGPKLGGGAEYQIKRVKRSDMKLSEPPTGQDVNMLHERAIAQHNTAAPEVTVEPSTSLSQPIKGPNGTPNSEEDDCSIYSEDTDLVLKQSKDQFETEVAKDLLRFLFSVSDDRDLLLTTAVELPQHLQRFSRKLGAEQPGRPHRELMRFVHKYRRSIASILRQGLDEEQKVSSSKSDRNMVSREKVDRWLRTSEEFDIRPDQDRPGHNKSTIHNQEHGDGGSSGEEEEEEDRNAIEDVSDIDEYRRLFTQSAAYRWLKSYLRRELLLTYPSQANIGRTISQDVFSPRIFRNISRRAGIARCAVLYQVDWDPITFLQQQDYGCDPVEAFRKALTLTGIANEAEGMTCEEYMYRTWPQTARFFLELMQMVLTSEQAHKSQVTLEDGTSLVASLHHLQVRLEASGHPDTIVEIGEQLTWVSSSMCSSDILTCASCCKPSVERTNLKETDASVSMTILLTRPAPKRVADCGSGADCWRQLFRNPTIVEGFPIRRRAQPGTGMELCITTMAALTGGTRINTFKDDFFIKGFCMMLVAVKALDDIMLWHALVNEDGSNIKYHDTRVQKIASPANGFPADLAQLTTMRHVIGWCSQVKNFAGAHDANFNINRCMLDSPMPGLALEKVSIGFSKYITANATIGLGVRDTPVYASRSSQLYIDRVNGLCEQYVVLYDGEKQRAWLVDGASALLHLLRLSLVISKKNHIGLIDGHQDLHGSESAEGSLSPSEVLINIMNLPLRKMANAEEITTLRTWSGKARPHQSLVDRQVTESFKETLYSVRDRFDLIYSSLDEIFQHHSDMSSSGVKFKMQSSPRTQLEGFQFRDIAIGNRPIKPFATDLHAGGKVWVDLIRELQAITLFGRGFGEILEPTSTDPQVKQKICRHWERLPADRGYLATSNLIFNKILTVYGDTNTDGKPWQLVKGVYVHGATPVFGACSCTVEKSHECDRVLVLLPEGRKSKRASHSLRALPPEGGAVILGNRSKNSLNLNKFNFKGKGKAPGGLNVPKPDEELAGSPVPASSTTEARGSEGLDVTDSTQPSAMEGSSLFSPRQASSRTSVGDDNDVIRDTSATRNPGPAKGRRQPLLRRAIEQLKKVSLIVPKTNK